MQSSRDEVNSMDLQTIALEDIINFYKQYGIIAGSEEECPPVPTAFDDIPLTYSSSTSPQL